jgi:hypothetical protein
MEEEMQRKKGLPVIDAEAIGFLKAAYYIIDTLEKKPRAQGRCP